MDSLCMLKYTYWKLKMTMLGVAPLTSRSHREVLFVLRNRRTLWRVQLGLTNHSSCTVYKYVRTCGGLSTSTLSVMPVRVLTFSLQLMFAIRSWASDKPGAQYIERVGRVLLECARFTRAVYLCTIQLSTHIINECQYTIAENINPVHTKVPALGGYVCTTILYVTTHGWRQDKSIGNMSV